MKKLWVFLVLICAFKSHSQWNLLGQLPLAETNTMNVTYLKFFSENIGYAQLAGVGLEGWFYVQIKTTDGGLHWIQTALPTTFYSKSPIFVGDADHFILAAFDGSPSKTYLTSDGGDSFTEIPFDSGRGDFYFKDNSNGYFFSNQFFFINLHTTHDGGQTWNSGLPTNPSLYDMYFPDAASDTGYAFSNSSVLKTINNGASWSETSMMTPNIGGRIKFMSPQVWYKGGDIDHDAMYKTIDGGMSWTQVAGFSGYKYEFTDLMTGFVLKIPTVNFNADHTHSIYRTVDGGTTWEAFGQFQPFAQYEHLIDFSFPDNQVAYVVTSTGLLYKCDNFLAANQPNTKHLGLYPNPASETLFIDGIILNSEPYTLYDLTGRAISKGRIETNTISTADLEPGYYFLKIADFEIAKFKKD